MFRLKFGAYWGARRESPEICAVQLATCLGSLGKAHPSLNTWFLKAGSRNMANRAVDTSLASLTNLMLAGQNRHEVDRSPIPELGFRIGIWNGGDDLPANLMIGCGGYSPLVGNALVLTLPVRDPVSAPLYEPSVLRSILAALVDPWQPDWAVCTTNELRTAQTPAPRTPVIGWLTFLGPTRPVPVSMETGVIEPHGAGHLIMLGAQPDAVTAQDVNQTRALLLREGSLGTMP